MSDNILIQSDSEVTQPSVICDKVMEYDYTCDSWHHLSALKLKECLMVL